MAEGVITGGPLPLKMGVPAAPVVIGFVSLLAFWLGGAGSGGAGAPTRRYEWRAAYGIWHRSYTQS